MATSEFTFEGGPVRHSTRGQVEAREVHRVLEVTPEGLIQIELVLEDLRVTIDGNTTEPLDDPWLYRVRPDGRVMERPARSAEDSFPIPLPDRPVRVGESWTRPFTLSDGGVTGQATTTWTLASVDRGGAPVAKLTARTAGTVTGAALPGLPPGAQARVLGTIRGEGEADWAVDRGRLLRSRVETVVEMTADIAAEGQTVQLRLRVRAVSARDPAAPAAAEPVAAELLIAPGRGIGALSLDLSVAELTSRIGIRFGSSQGAVLLAYGKPPASVDVAIPDLGGMRYLIYDDLGIAFGITTDEAHARRGPTHAPVGAVDVITVFIPGQRAKIFPAP
ncbi:MAG TPA: hypothetical protein VNN19_05985 [bacterium]|nr:hypothetical protein [bacterium]